MCNYKRDGWKAVSFVTEHFNDLKRYGLKRLSMNVK